MSYTPTSWVDGTTPVNAQNMNKIEQGIRQLDENKLDTTALQGAVDSALAQAKASGAFKGDKGETGAAGKTPVRGTDYWTSSDIAEIKSYVDEAILGGMW